MMFRILMALVFSLTMIGCATTRKTSTMDDLQTRVSAMEAKVDQKDEEIQDLKDQVDSLHEELRNVPVSEPEPVRSSAPVSAKSKDDILRVSVSAKELQKALKNAGYYKGSVDGKLGDKTKKSIKAFQEANGLTADGVVGQKTWMKLKAYAY